ncbi:MAG: DNA mismatch repair endonuclease MutL, partial [Sphaerobacter sp.]|nr:DNA mismatch repair endonuclease MutL [Sphaerobacter sp.]
VRDDGHGIPADELPLAVHRHATSKLTRFDDLAQLRSFGFRGEALASIAAVADLRIVSRPADSPHAACLICRGGQVEPPTVTAAAPGTTVTVRDLFAHVPARRAFLRQEQTEEAYVQRVVTACALAAPEVRFELISDGRTVLATDGSGDLGNAIVGVFGPDIAAEMVPIVPLPHDEPERPAVTVTGYVGLPTLTRGNRQQIILLVNRRWIESRALTFALEQAYHSLIMVGRYPVAVLHIEVAPDRLDVNVHPTKREVRFSDERLVFAAIQRAVRATLTQHTPAQAIPTMTVTPLTTPAVQRRLALSHPDQFRPAPAPAADDQASHGPPGPEPVLPDPGSAVPVLRVLGQVGATYIIAEGPDGMYLIDQHAAHERVLFEQLWQQYERSAPEVQALLEPLVIELSPAQLEAAERCREELAQLGFQIEPFGGNAVAVRAVPAIAGRREPRVLLLGILDEMAAGGRGTTPLESIAISTACHAAIRAGQTLSLPEMRELIAQLERCTAPRACGHGRPTMLHLSQEELERQFARR